MSEYTILAYITTFDVHPNEQWFEDIHKAISCGVTSGLAFKVWKLTQPTDGPRQSRQQTCVLLSNPQGINEALVDAQ